MSDDAQMDGGEVQMDSGALYVEVGGSKYLWPTYRDGTPVRIGDTVVSLRGPMTVERIVLDGDHWELLSTSVRINYPNIHTQPYIIEESTHLTDGNGNVIWNGEDSHAVREGEPCTFWPETLEEAVEYYGEVEGRKLFEECEKYREVLFKYADEAYEEMKRNGELPQ